MEEKEKKISTIIINVLYFVLGVLFICTTEQLITTFNYILVCVCGIIGIIQVLSYIFSKEKKTTKFNNWCNIYLGIIIIIRILWI